MGVSPGGSGLVGSFWCNLVTVGLIVRWVRWLTIWHTEMNKWEFQRSHHSLCPGNLDERHWTWSNLRLCNENFVFFFFCANREVLTLSRSVNILVSRSHCVPTCTIVYVISRCSVYRRRGALVINCSWLTYSMNSISYKYPSEYLSEQLVLLASPSCLFAPSEKRFWLTVVPLLWIFRTNRDV